LINGVTSRGELNDAYLTTNTAHTTDFVAIRKAGTEGKRDHGTEKAGTGKARAEGARDRKCSDGAARIVDEWNGLR